MPSPNQITPAQLSRLIGTPDCPTLLDVRLAEDVALDPHLIPTARQIRAQEVESLVTGLAGRRVVTICHRGRKLSEGAAALLRHYGVHAESLEGGAEAWAAAALPRVPIAALPASNTWVTRHRPKIDRIACPWLIRRFVDPGARFLYVPPAEVPDVARLFNAIPFDIDGTAFSHSGSDCTFDTMLKTFGLATPPLDSLARVIRAADTDRHDLAPQAAGLLAISVGLSRLYKDDLQQLEAGLGLYDALYRWARDGQEETHDWPYA